MRKLLTALAFTLALPVQADPVDQLASLLSGYDTFSARFEQFTLNEQNRPQESSSGHFSVMRPDRFVWITERPFPQQIVSDGEYIWIYDEDLEQATRKPADQGTETAPAMILNGRIHDLQSRYQIELVDAVDDVQVFDLTPRAEQEVLFSRIRLFFRDAVLAELMLDDSLGQRSSIQLLDARLNPELDPSQFEFRPPAGVDIILDEHL